MLYALDIETTGLDAFKDNILGIGIFNAEHAAFFTDVNSFNEWLLANPEAGFVLHRGSFDVNFLLRNDCDIRQRFRYDTRSLASILVPIPTLSEGEKHVFSLQNLGKVLLGLSAWKLDRENMSGYAIEEIERYCLRDCEVTWKLFAYLQERLSGKPWKFVETWLMPATLFCQQLEFNGVRIDEKGLQVYRDEISKQRDEVLSSLREQARSALIFYHEMQVTAVQQQYKEMYGKAKEKAKDQDKCRERYRKLEEAAICRLEPFNWNSSEQLKWLLRDYYQLDIYSKREDRETTDEAMLKTLEHPVAKTLVAYRELEKLCSTCIPALLENLSKDDAIHANYNVGGTRTGRLSSSGPNLQQIPKGKIRNYVQASNAARVLLTIDYGQIEPRILAHLAEEKELIHVFKEGLDPYALIAQKLLKIKTPIHEIKEKHAKERNVCKTAGLSILYGTGGAKLQEVLRKELGVAYSISDCRRFIEDYRDSFPGIQQLRSRLDRELANGKICYNLLGRPFHIAENNDIYMQGLNTLIQGSASDLVIFSQTAFVEPLLQSLGVYYCYRMVIHDEVVIELDAREADLLTKEVIVPAMTTDLVRALHLQVPLSVEYNINRCWTKP